MWREYMERKKNTWMKNRKIIYGNTWRKNTWEKYMEGKYMEINGLEYMEEKKGVSADQCKQMAAGMFGRG